MFTGIIEEVGTVEGITDVGNGIAVQVRAAVVLEGLAPGHSIAIDGVCQTVTSLTASGFVVQAVATTLARTTLSEFRVGRKVNLERALAVGDRLGGHLVQGHVDGVGEIVGVRPQQELVLIDLTLPPVVAEVTVLHGSIALNGVSLTVNALPAVTVAQVAIIPFTWSHTALSHLREGDGVNLEGDLIGKYVRRLLGRPVSAATGDADSRVDQDLLRAWGY